MTTLIELKREVETIQGSQIRMVFSRATEAHLIAQHIGVWLSYLVAAEFIHGFSAEANVGIILVGSRQFPETWDDRRM